MLYNSANLFAINFIYRIWRFACCYRILVLIQASKRIRLDFRSVINVHWCGFIATPHLPHFEAITRLRLPFNVFKLFQIKPLCLCMCKIKIGLCITLFYIRICFCFCTWLKCRNQRRLPFAATQTICNQQLTFSTRKNVTNKTQKMARTHTHTHSRAKKSGKKWGYGKKVKRKCPRKRFCHWEIHEDRCTNTRRLTPNMPKAERHTHTHPLHWLHWEKLHCIRNGTQNILYNQYIDTKMLTDFPEN